MIPGDQKQIRTYIKNWVITCIKQNFFREEDSTRLTKALCHLAPHIAELLPHRYSPPYSYNAINDVMWDCGSAIIQEFRNLAVESIEDALSYGNENSSRDEYMHDTSVEKYPELVEAKIEWITGYWIEQKHIPTSFGKILRMELQARLKDIIDDICRTPGKCPIQSILCKHAKAIYADASIMAKYNDPLLKKYESLTSCLKFVCELSSECFRSGSRGRNPLQSYLEHESHANLLHDEIRWLVEGLVEFLTIKKSIQKYLTDYLDSKSNDIVDWLSTYSKSVTQREVFEAITVFAYDILASPFVIEKYGNPYFEMKISGFSDAASAVLSLYEDGVSEIRIARKIGTSVESVHTIINNKIAIESSI